MWIVNGKKVTPNWLVLEPVVLLYDFDGPKIFTCKDSAGNTYLAYQCGEDLNFMRFLVVPFDEDSLRRLIVGEDNVRDSLTSDVAWIFDVDFQWSPVVAWCINVDSLPDGCIPRAGVMIWPHLPRRIKPIVARAVSTTQTYFSPSVCVGSTKYEYC